MLLKLSVMVLAVAAACLTAPSFAQTFPETTAVRATDLLRAPPPDGRRVTGIAKGERLRLYECVGKPTWCRVGQLQGPHPYNGWVTADALDGAVSTK